MAAAQGGGMSAGAAPILEMRGISKAFGAVMALKDVSLELRAGEVLALCGENGAGKSTLMKILSGSIPTREVTGEIRVRGEVQRFRRPQDAERAGIEMVYQEVALHPDLTIAENIFVGRLPCRGPGIVDRRRMREEAARALDLIGLKMDVRARVRGLSTSHQQMIAIARAALRDPAILVLDEPTSALTGAEAEALFGIMRRLTARGVGIVYISHKMDEIFRLADRIAVLRDGHGIGQWAAGEIGPDQVVEAMVGRSLEALYRHEGHASGEELFRIENISVPHPSRAGHDLVRDVSFTLNRGEILGLFGLVGAGRSEVMEAVYSGSYRSNPAARVHVAGQPVEIRTPGDAIGLGVAFLTADRKASGFVGTFDIARNVTLSGLQRIARHGLLSRRAERSGAGELARALSIRAPSVDHPVLALSGGNQQKVVLAKCLFAEPRILILDEPTRGIDVGAKAEIYRLMSRLTAEGYGIVLISSEMPELLAMSDRIIVIGGGRVQGRFSRAEARPEALMHAATGAAA